MQTPDEPRTPQAQTQTPSTALPPAFGGQSGQGPSAGLGGGGTPGTPVRFASTTGAFNLAVSTPSAHTVRELQPGAVSPTTAATPPSNGAVTTHKLRRPSLLSLAPSTGPKFASQISAPQSTTQTASQQQAAVPSATSSNLAAPVPTFAAPNNGPSWGLTAFSAPARVGSAPPIPIEGLTTSNSPIPSRSESGTSPMVEEKWQLRRSSGDSSVMGRSHPPFHGRPIPGSLLATLISESSPLEHEMRSEARLQRFISSHPSAVALTPRQRRMSRMTRGRFPESVDDDDDEPAPLGSRWRDDSESDSDEMMDDTEWPAQGAGSAVGSAFASIMDIDRPGSNGSWPRSDSGKSTPSAPGQKPTPPTPAAQRLEGSGQWKGGRLGQSPGASTLITSFGNVGFAGNGGGAGNNGNGKDTPIGSPTVEKTELAGSPSVNSPGMMQYRDPNARTGKRKANNAEDRFDPYKRPRASSPSPFQALSPSKSTSMTMPMPVPSSPSHAPLVASSLATSSPGYLSLGQSRAKPHHPYTRPMASRSRAASPALSIGSTSGVLSSSLNGNRTIGGAFIPTGPAAQAAVSAAQSQGAAPGSLGSLGFLSLQGEHGDQQEMLRDEDERRNSNTTASDAMEED